MTKQGDGCITTLTTSAKGNTVFKSDCPNRHSRMNYKSAKASKKCSNVPIVCQMCVLEAKEKGEKGRAYDDRRDGGITNDQ